MRTLAWLVILGLSACGGGSRVPPRQLGVAEGLAEAERCEQDADRHEQVADEIAAAGGARAGCGDVVLADQPRSGSDPVVMLAPCWTGEQDVVTRHLEEAERLRAEASAHRAHARELLAAEDAACAAVPYDELTHTPFAHTSDLAAVTAELDGDRVSGARIQFRPVEGLTTSWLRTAIACHHARAAARGYDPTYMGYDPSVLAGAVTEVTEADDGIVVVIRSSDDATALSIYGRAEDLLSEEP
jgi:hypothetical protein